MKTSRVCCAAWTALAVLSACSKTEGVSGETETIRFAAPVQATRAAAYADADRSSVFQVRDWYNRSGYHIENTLAYDNYVWGYGSDVTYIWEPGTHLFFGWLHSNASFSSTTFFNQGLSLGALTPVLTVPEVKFDNLTRQYDFLYSYGVSRSTTENNYDEVPLVFRHLFARVAISFKVKGDEAILLKGVSLNNTFKNKSSAAIDFRDGSVTYTKTVDGYFCLDPAVATPTGPRVYSIAFDKNTSPLDVLSQSDPSSAAASYYLVWPMEKTELANVLDVTFQLYENGTPTGTDITRQVSFPSAWEAGNQYAYTVTYMGGVIQVDESVTQWNYDETVYAVSDPDDPLQPAQQPAMATWMGWDPDSYTESGGKLQVIPGTPVHGTFRIYSPLQGTYRIEMEDTENYVITTSETSPGSSATSTLQGSIEPGATIDFYIHAGSNSSGTAIESGLSFSVTPDTTPVTGSRWYSLDSELQRGNPYTIVIPSN